MSTLTTEKYTQISQDGEKSFKEGTAKTIGPVETWPLAWRDEYHVAVYFDESSNKLIKDIAIELLKSIALQNNADYWFAEEAFPIHATMVSGYKEVDGKILEGTRETQEAYLSMINDSVFKKISAEIKNIIISFDDILITGDNVILTASEIPLRILNFRNSVSDLEKINGLIPKTLDNILHVTIGRLKQIPDDEDSRIRFIDAFQGLRALIASNPITVITSSVFNGRNMMSRKEDL